MAQESARQCLGLRDEEIDLLYEECLEKLNEVEHDLMDIVEGCAEKTPDFVNRIFRAFHSVKGAGDFLGNVSLKKLSHAAENVLGAVREGGIELTPAHAETLLSAVARLRQMISDQGQPVDSSCEERDLRRILALPPVKPGEEDRLCPAHPAASAGARLPAGQNSSGELKILLVEDDFTSRVMLQGLFRRYGPRCGHCDVAVNGKEAVEAFRAALGSHQGYDLICMDVRMPEMDGTQAVEQIRAIEEAEGIYSTSGVRIFMTTAISDLKTIHASYRALCDAYLFKPVDGAQLEQHMVAFGLVRHSPAYRVP